MEFQTLSEKIKWIREDFAKDKNLIKGLPYNTKQDIDRIVFYQNDTFVECSDPNALFWQVVTPYNQHFAKMIDLDPKDFRPEGQGDTNFYQVWVLRKLLGKWIEDENFGVVIDDLTRNVSAFGSAIWKVVPDEDGKCVELVDLRNVAFDQTVKSIRDTDFVEFHYLTENEIRYRENAWDNVDKIIEVGKKTNKEYNIDDNKYEIYEYVGYWNGKKIHRIGCGYGDAEVVAFEEKLERDESPYYDFHLWEYQGRWLRKGSYQTCFIEQERANTVVNENAAATSIASLLLLRSGDPGVNGNVLTQAVNGQIITSQDLQQVAIDNRAYSTLLNELTTINQQVQKKLMLPDIATGDQLPSGTPFRGMALMSNAYKSAFKQIRNRIAEGVKDVLLEEIIPDLVKKWNTGAIVEIAENEEDIKMYDRAIKDKALLEAYKVANEQGIEIKPEDEQQIEQTVDEEISKNGRRVDVEKKFFNFDYGLKIDPTGETYDKAQQNDAIVQALTLKLQNPAVVDEPEYRQLLENNGIPPQKMTAQQKKNIMDMSIGNQQPPMPQVPEMALNSQVDTNV